MSWRSFSKIKTTLTNPKTSGVVALLAFALLGSLYLLFSTHAATPTAAYETEGGSISGNASTVSDSTASASSAVKLGSGGNSGSTSCPLPKYPSKSCTGVPVGTSFSKTVSGDYTVTTNGQVIDSWHITGDLLISAQNVVIKNTQVDGHIDNEGTTTPPSQAYISSSFTLSDSTIGSATCDPVGVPSINGHDFTASRVYLRGHQDGIDVVGSNVTVNDSLITPCMMGDFHTDGMQDQCDHAITTVCAHIKLVHNTFDSSAPGSNSALNIGSQADGEDVADVIAQNNLFIGGTYTTGFDWDNVGDKANWIVTNNVWSNNSWAYGPVDTATDHVHATCSNQTWSGNQIVTIDSNYNVTSVVRSQPCE